MTKILNKIREYQKQSRKDKFASDVVFSAHEYLPRRASSSVEKDQNIKTIAESFEKLMPRSTSTTLQEMGLKRNNEESLGGKYSKKWKWIDKNSNIQSKILGKKKQADLKNEFAKLASRWKKETAKTSSITRKIAHLDYLRIIAKGEKVLPLILEEMQNEPNHWFIALHVLSNESPVAEGSDFDSATQQWLAWGKQKGFI